MAASIIVLMMMMMMMVVVVMWVVMMVVVMWIWVMMCLTGREVAYLAIGTMVSNRINLGKRAVGMERLMTCSVGMPLTVRRGKSPPPTPPRSTSNR